jgi:hypothetical protein
MFSIDKRILFVIVTPHHDLSGRNSVVECHLAKVDVDGSNPFARSIFLPKGRHSQVVRQRSAKPLLPSSNLGAASIEYEGSAACRSPLFRRQSYKQLSHVK